jgi:alpha-1,6-mannosyltransferase
MAAASTSSGRARWALGALVAGYAVLAVLAAAPRSPLVPPFPSGAEPASWLSRAASWLSLDGSSRPIATSLCVVVLAVLVVAFVVLVVEAWNGRVTLRAVGAAGAVALVIGVAAPLLLSRDVYSYAAYGRELAVHHANPYVVPPSTFRGDPFFGVLSPEWRSTRSVYGPAFTLLSVAVAKMWSGSPGATVFAFKLLAGLAAGGAAFLAAGAARRWGLAERQALAVSLVALNPVIVIHTVGGGHNDALVALGVAGAAWLAAPGQASEGRPIPSMGRDLSVTAVLTLASLVKVVAAIPLLLWWWSVLRSAGPGDGLRRLAPHAALAAGLTAVLSAPLFAGWHSVTAVANLASRQGWASGARLVTRIAHALHLPGASPVVYGAFLMLFALIVWRLERLVPAREPARWGRALLLFALFAPYLLPWYVAWFVPILALIEDAWLVRVGVALGGLLALTGVPAEADGAAWLWRDMMLGVHHVAAAVTLILLGLALRHAFQSATDALAAPR